MSKQTPSDLYLTADHHDDAALVAAALHSNPPGTCYSPTTTQPAHGSGRLSFDDESPYLDFDNDGEFDDSFDLNPHARMIGDLPGGEQLPPNDELHDKRKSMGGKDDDNEGGGKRREGEDRTSKKPGRKPLTSEPTSKRKAQNRAAQRAFRERKEKHLRDLETKVEDLEKASEATSQENSMLRAQVERLQVELKEYRKRLSWISSGGPSRSNSLNPGAHKSVGPFNQQSDFQFEFPKFGDLTQLSASASDTAKTTSSTQASSHKSRDAPQTRTSSGTSASASVLRAGSIASSLPSSKSQAPVPAQAPAPSSISQSPINTNGFTASPLPVAQSGGGDTLTSLFSPSILESARHGSFGSYFSQAQPAAAVQNAAAVSSSSISNTNSPSSSADSQHAASSIGTSPEPCLNSPANRVLDAGTALNTISETNPVESLAFGKDELCKQLSSTCGCSEDPIPPILNMGQNLSNELPLGFGTTANTTADFTGSGLDPDSFHLLASQPNHSAFDPLLFGDYRETQESILSQDFGNFFNDAYPLPDLGSPSHNFNDVSTEVAVTTAAATQPARPSLLKQVESVREGKEEVVPDNDKPMSCNKIWDRLQSMEKFRNGEIDIDSLCSELRAKAKCSEGGAVVDKRDVDRILGRVN